MVNCLVVTWFCSTTANISGDSVYSTDSTDSVDSVDSTDSGTDTVSIVPLHESVEAGWEIFFNNF